MAQPIVIMTDFGTKDPFVGIMKGVISGISPVSPIIDLTHEIPSGDIRQAGVVLWQSFSYFPKGTIFLVVVDPGVGTHRHPLILNSQGYSFIGPDNGVFTFICEEDTQAWELKNPHYQLPNPTMTFHGRDIFAPGAAFAAQGIQGPEFGDPFLDFQKIQAPRLETPSPGMMVGEVLYSDRFGNALTSLGVFNLVKHGHFAFLPWLGDCTPIEIDLENSHLLLPRQGKIKWASTFAEIPENKCAIIVGSSGLIEIAANRQSAKNLQTLETSDPVKLYFPPTSS